MWYNVNNKYMGKKGNRRRGRIYSQKLRNKYAHGWRSEGIVMKLKSLIKFYKN